MCQFTSLLTEHFDCISYAFIHDELRYNNERVNSRTSYLKRLSGPSQFENFPSGFSLFTSYVTLDIYFLSRYITQSIPTGAPFALITVKFVMFALWDHEASPKILLSWVSCSIAVSIAINHYISWFWLKIIILYGPLPTAPPPSLFIGEWCYDGNTILWTCLLKRVGCSCYHGAVGICGKSVIHQ